MASSGWTITLSLVVAGGAIGGGWYLSQRQKGGGGGGGGAVGVELPLSVVSSYSLNDYCRSRGKTSADYMTLPVRGCPPKAPREAVVLIEAVVDYRQCSGTALIPKQ